MQYVVDPAHTSRAYVIEKGGTVRLLVNDVLQPNPVLDVSSTILTSGECGILGVAFDPQFASNNYVYFHYNLDAPIRSCIVRYTMSADGTTLSDPYPIFSFSNEQTFSHKGGSINFGPDGYLYFATGDGGISEDPHNNAQNGGSYMGKLLRINVATDDFPNDPDRNYGIPLSNPYRNSSTILHEIYGVGLRNPFRWSFDSLTGGIMLADVGQDRWEEVNYVPVFGARRNFGWRVREGIEPFMDNLPAFSNGSFDPFFVYDHSYGRAIIGGYIYRGNALDPVFKGRYFLADATSKKVGSIPFGISRSEAVTISQSLLRDHTVSINDSLGVDATLSAPVSISPDANGEPMIVDLYRGQLVRLVP